VAGSPDMIQAPIIARDWTAEAIRRIDADFNRSADTHLIPVELSGYPEIELYLKDESSHPTGSLKHRLARSLFLYALCNGWIGPQTPIVEASSGSTAVSEAYFARMLGLRFIAVVPRATALEKIAAIEFQGGECHFVDEQKTVHVEAARLAREVSGHYMDQFTYAERATDWRGNNNIAESIFRQLAQERHPIPRWIICGAGTGGTSATLGRYVRYYRYPTEICVSDPEGSVFHQYYADRRITAVERCDSCIEGIGRQHVEPSFIPEVVDRMIAVSDADSIAAARVISERLGRRCGGSTGTNIWACARLIREMATSGEAGSVISILCDQGERYASTYFNDAWIAQKRIELAPGVAAMRAFFAGKSS
jgi:cysteine synthase